MVTGTVISSTDHNALTADLATGLSTCILKDGTQTLTANIPMGSFKLTGLASGTARTDSINVGQVEDGFPNYVGTVGGTADVITLTPSPAITAYAAGQRFTFIASGANTTNVTVAVSGLTAQALTKFGSVALVANDIPSGSIVTIVHDGTRFQIDKIDYRTAVTAYTAANTHAGNEVFSGAPSFTGTPIFSGSPIVENLVNGICEGRLTLTSGLAVTTGDVLAAETVYFTPFKGNRIALYDGTNWELHTFTELSIDVPDATNSYDVFIYSNSGTPTLELTAWTNETTRATAIAFQNGIPVKTGATTRRLLGSFYCTTAGNGQVEDSYAKRNLNNYYNQFPRPMKVVEATDSWNYDGAFRQANGSAANQLEFMICISEQPVRASVVSSGGSATADITAYVGIGLDGTTNVATVNPLYVTPGGGAGNRASMSAEYMAPVAVGRHRLTWLEFASGATFTWLGDNGGTSVQSGIIGVVWG